MTQALLWAAGGTGLTALLTALGAATVFFFKKAASPHLHRLLLGFAAGVMIAASVWSLLIPAIDQAGEMGMIGWLPAAGGFLLGIGFLTAMDALLPHLTPESFHLKAGPDARHRSALLVLAVTLHNIPEGMAVGISFALGIGIQNFPEGAAISLPLRQEGMGRGRSFVMGALSGLVEPVFGILTVLIAGSIQPLMPWLLSFAAGAMLYVVVEELIPGAQLEEMSHLGTWGVMAGFLIMMILDVALG